jgi:uncharacterized membrane protein HdeD (DUF308 family)
MGLSMDVLRTALRVNAASCLLFGALFTLMPAPVAGFLGVSSVIAITIVGAALLINGGHLLIASWRKRVRPLDVCYFSTGDLLWVTVTLALVASESFLTTTASVIVSLAVAAFVGAMGVIQLWALSNERSPASIDDRLPDHFSGAQAIAASWRSMKPWVKYWLFALNAVFLLALAFWPDPIARFTLAAYVASGPWLVALMTYQRGLTRLLGVAHLIPWIPLIVYLALRVGSDLAGPQLTLAAMPLQWAYATSLLLITSICLVIDIVDVGRWFRGERYRLGAINAARAGASSRAG